MTITKLRRWGNGQGVLISTPLIRELGKHIGDEFEIKTEGNNIVLTPKKNESRLDRLFENYPDKVDYPHERIDVGKVGNELN